MPHPKAYPPPQSEIARHAKLDGLESLRQLLPHPVLKFLAPGASRPTLRSVDLAVGQVFPVRISALRPGMDEGAAALFGSSCDELLQEVQGPAVRLAS